jgi:hypothetical protein
MTPTAPTQRINTKKVTGRRQLDFSTLADVLADAEKIAASEGAGTLRILGNWTPGQAFNHVATWASFPYDGYPPKLKPPWWVKILAKMMRGRLFSGGLKPGFNIPGVPGGTLGIEPISTQDGLAKLRAAFARLDTAPPAIPNPVFGPLTHDEWKKLNISHAMLHFSFLVPK